MASDLSLFLRQLLQRPQAISAVAPSSPALAAAMAAPLTPGAGKVAEFGPGTGRLTKAILARGVPPGDLTLYEMNEAFVDHLRAAFPGVTVHCAPAQDMKRLGQEDLAAVVSGLPLLSMPEAVQHSILAAAFETLRPDGIYIQFTYGPKPPVAEPVRRALGLTVTPGPRIWANLPPARVYIYRRDAEGMRRYAN